MTRLLTILLALFSLFIQAAPDTLYLSRLDSFVPVVSYADFAQAPVTHSPQDLQYHKKLIKNVGPDTGLFIHLLIKNNLPSEQTVFLRLPLNEYWEMDSRSPAQKWHSDYAGWLEKRSRLDRANEKQFLDLTLKPGQSREIFLKTYNSSTRRATSNYSYVMTEREFYKTQYQDFYENLTGFGISIFYQGAVGLMMLYMFFLYFQNNRDKTYLFYGLYMLFGMYYLLQKIAGDGPYFFIFAEHAPLRHLLNEPVQWLIYIFYNFFVISFLHIKKHSKSLYRTLLGLNVIYAIYLLGELVFMLVTFDKVLQGQLYLYSRIVVIIVAVYIIISMAVKVRSPLVGYVVTGSSLFLAFTVLAMLYSMRIPWLPETEMYPINFMQIGIMLEILCFSLGLGRRIHIESQEKEKLQKAYIDQLVRNEEIFQQSNKKLSDEVYEQTAEVINKTRELEKEREKKIKAEYEKQLAESEMNALRLQMNPHFIFNSLNAIRYYILKEDSEKASDYITSFSKLLRMILQHSKQSIVKLSEELEALTLYLGFEQQRFENKFEFTISKGEEVWPERLMLQPMIIQPFVENSIWHGLMHKEGKGHLKIDLSLINEVTLQVIIEDDGIGRKEARRLEENQENRTYKSMGMQITRDRLKLMEKLRHGETGYEVVDLIDETGEALGTRVILKIRLK